MIHTHCVFVERKKNQGDLGEVLLSSEEYAIQDTLKCKGKACPKYGGNSQFRLISQNTGFISITCSLYFTKKCCRWVSAAPLCPFNLRSSTLRALAFVSEGSDLV